MADAQTEARAIERFGRNMSGMIPFEKGDYVRYTDHATALAAKEAELQAVKAELTRLANGLLEAEAGRIRAEARIAALEHLDARAEKSEADSRHWEANYKALVKMVEELELSEEIRTYERDFAIERAEQATSELNHLKQLSESTEALLTQKLIDAHRNFIDAWEALPGGKFYSKDEIARWLTWSMKPAVDTARKELLALQGETNA